MTAEILQPEFCQVLPHRKSYSRSSVSSSNCCFRCRRAAFLIARLSAATACFSAWRSFRVRRSAELGNCVIFGRRAPTCRSFGFAYGFTGEVSASYSRQKGVEGRKVEG